MALPSNELSYMIMSYTSCISCSSYAQNHPTKEIAHHRLFNVALQRTEVMETKTLNSKNPSSINQKKANRQSKKKERGGNSNTTRIYTRKLPVSQLKRVGQRPCVMTRMDASACLRDGARCKLSNHTVVVQSKIKESLTSIIFLLLLSLKQKPLQDT
ncbi:unnamed protein product [Clavelina lepadiformis]|uniref:Uncharacterized protein n=1 Tax=Clavelina lepadiformis TaxID=159417 RepID=A0ABP0H281_CLALP